MKIAYFDCFSGISGDMCLGALVSAGIPLKELQKGLDKLHVKGLRLHVKGLRLSEKKVVRSGVSALKVDVDGPKSGPSTWAQTKELIRGSTLSSDIKTASLGIFERIFRAEAKVHGVSIGRIHLHEMGSIDSIADVVGTVLGMHALGIKKVYSSPVNLGSGSVKTAHGVLPVPAPAALEMLKEVPIYSDGTPYELCTPTGAALIKSLASSFGDIPKMKIETVGVGAGSREIKGRPNVLRVFIGEADGSLEPDVAVIETNIDDMNPQVYGYLTEKFLKEGALDVYLTQTIMKKGRPGVKLTVICHEDKRMKLTDTIFRETTTLGVRFYRAGRTTLDRKSRSVDTEFGRVRVKEALLPDGARVAPEYEDCARIAKERGLPLIDVIRRVGVAS